MTFKPNREFNGVAGQKSIDTMGPETLSRDLDKINKMFDPNSTHSDGQKGGIGKGNLNFSFGDSGATSGISMAEEIGSKEITELKDPSNSGLSALTVWKQIKAIVLLIVAHFANHANPHGVTNSQVGLGNVTNDRQATKLEFDGHTSNIANPHSVTKAQIGLGNADNTSDMGKPISAAQQTALDSKVDKVTGKSLVPDTEIAKLAGIAAGAEANVQADWNVSDTNSDAYIKNKPVLGTAASRSVGNTNGTIPVVGSDGKLPFEIIPAAAITEVKAFNTVAERDGWTAAQEGDVALVSTPPSSYIKSSSGWLVMPTPTDLVLSVAGRTGNVVLTAADVAGALTVSDILNILTSTATNKALSAAQGKTLKDICDTISTSLSNFMTTYNAYVTQTDTALATKLQSESIKAVRYNAGNFEYTTDNVVWTSLNGAKGDKGKGYNPRDAWASGGSYVNDDFIIDVVRYNGSSYYAKTTHSGSSINPAADTTNWGALAISGAVATGADVLLTGYEIGLTGSEIAATDTVNIGIGKLEKRVSDGETNFASNVLNVALTGISFLSNAAITATDTVLSALGKIQAQMNGKSEKSVVDATTLTAANWIGSSAPYTYSLSVSGVTAESNQEILPAISITAAQLKELQLANIQDGGQSVETIILSAFGKKPTSDIPIRVLRRGD